jgi:hypothetical protein
MDCKWEGVRETILYLMHIRNQNNIELSVKREKLPV